MNYMDSVKHLVTWGTWAFSKCVIFLSYFYVERRLQPNQKSPHPKTTFISLQSQTRNMEKGLKWKNTLQKKKKKNLTANETAGKREQERRRISGNTSEPGVGRTNGLLTEYVCLGQVMKLFLFTWYYLVFSFGKSQTMLSQNTLS